MLTDDLQNILKAKVDLERKRDGLQRRRADLMGQLEVHKIQPEYLGPYRKLAPLKSTIHIGEASKEIGWIAFEIEQCSAKLLEIGESIGDCRRSIERVIRGWRRARGNSSHQTCSRDA